MPALNPLLPLSSPSLLINHLPFPLTITSPVSRTTLNLIPLRPNLHRILIRTIPIQQIIRLGIPVPPTPRRPFRRFPLGFLLALVADERYLPGPGFLEVLVDGLPDAPAVQYTKRGQALAGYIQYGGVRINGCRVGAEKGGRETSREAAKERKREGWMKEE